MRLRGVDRVERVQAKAGAVLVEPGQLVRFYWLVLEGEIRAERPEPDGIAGPWWDLQAPAKALARLRC
jgi:CRP-like cAMP-binding protein